jgi:CheY-like chemotaxis protein
VKMLKRVLVVEDEQTIAELIQNLLETEGFEVVAARNGQEALDRLPNQPIDLILSDIMMPYMDGWQLCNYLQDHPAYRHIKLILMSAAKPDKPNNGCEYTAFIEKPFALEQLLEIIMQYTYD